MSEFWELASIDDCKAVMLYVLREIRQLRKEQSLELPLEVAITDADDRHILRYLVDDAGVTFPDGDGLVPLDSIPSHSYHFPVVAMITDARGNQFEITMKPDESVQ